MRFIQSVVSITAATGADSGQTSEGLYGEAVDVLDDTGLRWHIRNRRDGYTGFVNADAIGMAWSQSTHIVTTRMTPVFSTADIKSRVVMQLVFGSELCLEPHDDRFLRTGQGWFVIAAHCHALSELPVSDMAADLVSVAEHYFLGCPYVWGGRSTCGCDCSGLLQMSAFALGVALPRDSGPQEASIADVFTLEQRQRNDLVFWPEHVGILKDRDTLVHATAHSMLTVREDLSDVIQRAGQPASLRRLSIAAA